MPYKEIVAKLRAQGLCVRCWKPSEKSQCKVCNEKANEWRRATEAKRRASSLCVRCGKGPLPDNARLCQKHIESDRAKDRRKCAKLKDEVFAAYGGYICNCCGETGRTFLSIDHINNDGSKHRREIGAANGTAVYAWLRKNKFPPGFQVLCFNCNHSKSLNKGVCEHKLKEI